MFREETVVVDTSISNSNSIAICKKYLWNIIDIKMLSTVNIVRQTNHELVIWTIFKMLDVYENQSDLPLIVIAFVNHMLGVSVIF